MGGWEGDDVLTWLDLGYEGEWKNKGKRRWISDLATPMDMNG